MASITWSLYCPMTGQRHEGLACGSCLAQNPSVSTSTSTFVQGIEVVDLLDSPPHSQTSTTIFTAPNTIRFPHYNRIQGAEQHRQSAIARTKKGNPTLSTPALSATVVFHLLTQIKNEEGILIPTSCKTLGIV
jgi:hypothetical protein